MIAACIWGKENGRNKGKCITFHCLTKDHMPVYPTHTALSEKSLRIYRVPTIISIFENKVKVIISKGFPGTQWQRIHLPMQPKKGITDPKSSKGY